MTDILVPGAAVGAASRVWDEEAIDLAAGAGQVADCLVAGFTPEVQDAAARFRAAWRDHLDRLAVGAEHRADGLRDALREMVGTDELTGMAFLLVGRYLEEVR
jgi:hypothetical protein